VIEFEMAVDQKHPAWMKGIHDQDHIHSVYDDVLCEKFSRTGTAHCQQPFPFPWRKLLVITFCFVVFQVRGEPAIGQLQGA